MRSADAAEPGGTVYAIDISSTFIDNILRTCREQGLMNVTGIVNTLIAIGLPADSIDLAFITDTYHHFEYPRQTLASIHQALRNDGRIIIIDFRATRVSAQTGLWDTSAATRPRSFRNCMQPASGLWMTNP